MSALQDVLREAATKSLMRQGVQPKARTKRSKNGFVRQDTKELSKHPGSSRSRIIDVLKAIAATHTGATVVEGKAEDRLGQLGTRQGRVIVVKRIPRQAPK